MSHRKESADWDQEKIAGFWNWYSSNPYLVDEYFSKQAGEGIVRLLQLSGKLHGNLLDYGCGPGFFLHHLMALDGLECHGLDFSEKSVNQTNRRFSGQRNWHGAVHCPSLPSCYESGMFDVVTCIETIEHVMETQFTPLFAELKRLTAPGGMILLTTPNNENLDRAMHYCPFCDSEFHGVQHLRAFTETSLTALLEENGLSVIFCKAINLMELIPKTTRLKDLSASQAYSILKQFLRKVRYAASPKKLTDYFDIYPPLYAPHLCALISID